MDEYGAILDQARTSIAAGRVPDWSVLEARVKAVALKPRAHADPVRERRALEQLKLLASVQRARARVAPPPAAARSRPAALRDRPTITGNMDVRRERDGEAFILRWEGSAGVSVWEVRFSERTGPRGVYAVRAELELPATATSVEVPLGAIALRVHLLGRDRGGRLVQRAVMSSLTRESWSERWQRRASAA
ncbi:MAG TPA: hypothetical protein VNC40_13890 [Gaiellaceae bacterium]|nr:hypothetical protein [Gaiellaceae bacterium]